MRAYTTPGVYFEWLDTSAQTIAIVRTDVAGFVGFAERGPLHEPVRIESWTQFRSTFGRHTTAAYLAYAVEGFFANGGEICYVVRVADPSTAATASLHVRLDDGRILSLRAVSPGRWGNRLRATLTRARSERYTLTLRLPSGEQEQWRDLTFEENDERFAVRVLNGESIDSKDQDAAEERHPLREPAPGSMLVRAGIVPGQAGWTGPLIDLRRPSESGRFDGGEDGLWTIGPEHVSGRGAPPGLTWGLAALERVPAVAIVAVPDIMPQLLTPVRVRTPLGPDCSRPCPPAPWSEPEADPDPDWPPVFPPDQIRELQRAIVSHCDVMRNRVAVLDTRIEDASPQAAAEWRRGFDSKYAAIYYPWLRVAQPDHLDAPAPLRNVPPSGHVAGIYARVERQVGVHKPPANELVEGAKDVSVQTDDIAHGFLNDQRVNVIRAFAGRGIRVAGARTVSSDSEWRYVNVRRLMVMIERAIDRSTQWLVFEPNRQDVWRDVDRVLRAFLDGLWRRGMLDGATAAEAYDVACDLSTMADDDIVRGQLIAKLGVQPPWPAEFVIVRIGRTESGLQVIEGRGEANGAIGRA